MINNLNEAIAHERKEAENYTITSNALYEDYYKISLNCQELANYHEQLAEWLTELQERGEADRWIPVSERLPEKRGRCLVTTDFGDVCMDSFVDGIFVLYLGNVTHWKPLPKAPESEVTNGNTDKDT